MRLSIVALSLGILVSGFITPAAHAETNSTNIDTKTNIEISAENLNNDPFLLSLNTILVQNTVPAVAIMTPEELKYQERMSLWKIKQAPLWNNLPRGKFTINASAYTASADECGNDKGITASGVKVQEKRTLACPPNMPFGAKVSIDGMGVYTCEDRGGAIKGNHFDIYMETKQEAFAFGRRNLEAQIVIE